MENFDFNVQIPGLSVSIMGLSIIALIMIMAFTYLYIRRAYPNGYKGMFIGMASYFIICDVIVALVYYVENFIGKSLDFSSNPAMETAMKNVGSVVALAIQCAVIVYCLEFAYRKFAYQPGITTFGNIMAFGFGFSAVESLQWIVNMAVNYWFPSVSLNGVGLKTYYDALGEEEFLKFWDNMAYLFEHNSFHYIWIFFERLAYIAFIIALVVMISMVGRKLLSKTFLPTIMVWYFIYYIPGILKQFGVVKSEPVILIFEIVIAVAINLFTWQLIAKLLPDDAEKLTQIRKGGIYEALFAPRKSSGKPKTSIAKAANSNSSIKEDKNL